MRPGGRKFDMCALGPQVLEYDFSCLPPKFILKLGGYFSLLIQAATTSAWTALVAPSWSLCSQSGLVKPKSSHCCFLTALQQLPIDFGKKK